MQKNFSIKNIFYPVKNFTTSDNRKICFKSTTVKWIPLKKIEHPLLTDAQSSDRMKIIEKIKMIFSMVFIAYKLSCQAISQSKVKKCGRIVGLSVLWTPPMKEIYG